MNGRKVAFFFTAFKDAAATEAALAAVRRNYPQEEIRLFSDGGDDFSDLAGKFACDYQRSGKQLITRVEGPQFATLIDAVNYLNRLHMMTVKTDADWIVLMDDGVRCRKRIDYWPTADAAGPPGSIWSKNFQTLVIKIYGSQHTSRFLNYGNCGGSIVRVQALRSAIEFLTNDMINLAQLCDPRFGGFPDALVSGVLQLSGFSYQIWLDHSEEMGGVFSPAGVAAFDNHSHLLPKSPVPPPAVKE